MPETQSFSVRDLLPQPPEGMWKITGDQYQIPETKDKF
jgi:hypothetical protein